MSISRRIEQLTEQVNEMRKAGCGCHLAKFWIRERDGETPPETCSRCGRRLKWITGFDLDDVAP